MANTLGLASTLRVVPPATLEAALKAEAEAKAANTNNDSVIESSLVGYVRKTFETYKRHRNDAARGWNHRLLDALNAFNGKYSASKLAEIRQFGGSEAYARVVAGKCRGAAALLRDIYLSPDRPWAIKAPKDPDVQPAVIEKIRELAAMEAATLAQSGYPVTMDMVEERINQLMKAARDAEKVSARERAKLATAQLDEILTKGNFYKAMAAVFAMLVMYPFAVLKGPVVRVVPVVKWRQQPDGTTRASTQNEARMFWEAINPFDVWFTPGVANIENASVIERTRYARSELNDMLDLPGYQTDNVRKALTMYGVGGVTETADYTDEERAAGENRESPTLNESGVFEGLEFHGPVQGSMLVDMGVMSLPDPMSDQNLTIDPVRDYMVQVWVIGQFVIKVQMSPSPRQRHPYKVTSFEKVPGSVIGNALPDILADIADAANATLRSLINNESMASGPQVVINMDRLHPGADASNMYPWKRWFMSSDPMASNAQDPVSFFQPKSNAAELLTVYKDLGLMADELSSIPRYQTGGGATGGAGRTSSGLSMLMANASKVLQTVAGNVDDDIVEPTLEDLYDLLMLTDTSSDLRGDENISVLGVYVAQLREVQRARQLEFLQITANPLDAQIMGMEGRAKVLRSVSSTIGMEGDDVVPREPPEPPPVGQQGPGQGGGGVSAEAPAPSGDSQAAQAPRMNITPGQAGGGQTT